MSNRTRKRGAKVTPISGGPEGALYYTFLYDNKVHIFGREGVQVILAPGGIFRGEYAFENTEIHEEDCRKALNMSGTWVDAADVVRSFGDRLEANFGNIYRKVTGEEGPTHDY